MSKDCFTISKASKVSVRELGRQATIVNETRETYSVCRVDGCVIKQQVACDFLISKSSVGDLAIELKGCDVDHAMKQIECTFDYWHANGLREGKFSGLIVCSRYPRIDTKIQRAKQRIAKKFEAPIHVVTQNLEFQFEELLIFKG